MWEFLLRNWYCLKFSPSVNAKEQIRGKPEPQEAAAGGEKPVQQSEIGTKSQQALKLLHEQNKEERKFRTKQEKEEEKERLFELRQKKRKEKHRGR